MQAKGLVKFFAIALVVVCLYQLSFSFVANRVDNKAEAYADQRAETLVASFTGQDKDGYAKEVRKDEKRRFLDSVQNQAVYPVLGHTYKEVREKQLNYGLDLQGGMSVVLQVQVEEVVKALANESLDQNFNTAIEKARDLQLAGEGDYVTLFYQAWQEVTSGKDVSLASIFSTPELQDRVKFGSTDQEVLDVIRSEAKDAVQRTFENIRTRIDRFGVANPNINLLEASNRIVVELPGVDDPDRVGRLLQSTARLEFWETYENGPEVQTVFNNMNTALKDKLGVDDEDDADKKAKDAEANADADADNTAETDTTKAEGDDGYDPLAEDGGDEESSVADFKKKNPFFSVVQPVPSQGPVVAYVNGVDTAQFRRYMAMPEVADEMDQTMKFLLGRDPFVNEDEDEGTVSTLYPVYVMRSDLGDFVAPLSGDVITDARYDLDASQNVVVSMSMNSDGAKKWQQMTRENIQKYVGIVLDDVVYSCPQVQGEIAGGNTQISGSFDIAEATDLANVLKAGRLPAPARIVEEAVVGPTLGEKSVRSGLMSLFIGFLLVFLFMVLYYSGGGIIADIALLLNIFFVIGVLSSLGAVLTLPGIAGIVLTIGMAVDANVIIFERIREELALGSSLKKAIKDGFSKSYSAIIDANVTTLITAAILYYFGLGPVLGFATVLMVGIFCSLFTAVLMSRLITDWWVSSDRKLAYSTGFSKGMFKNLNYDFISRRKMGYYIALVFLVIGIGSYVMKGFELGVDFKGGRSYVVQFPQEVDANQVRSSLEAPFKAAPLVRTYGGDNQLKITTSYLTDSNAPDASEQVKQALYTGIKDYLGGASYEAFNNSKTGNIQSAQTVGPTIADDIRRGALWATIFALLGIFFYILLRFRKWQYGMAAVLTIMHDTMILLTLFTLLPGILPFTMEIDQNFIAALLTVIGYSINDTVVVFDRIREYLQLNPKRDQKEVINEAINSTLSRTIITSVTTLFVVAILFFFGGEVLRGFSFALMIGIIVGTYSSIFIATPLVIDLSDQYNKRVNAGDKKSSKSKAKAKATA